MTQKESRQASKRLSFSSQHTWVLVSIITVILTLFSFIFFQLGNDLKKTSVIELKNNWTFFVEHHSDQQLLGENTRRIEFVDPNEALIMQQPLHQSITNPELIVRANHQWVTVLLDNQPIYQYQKTAEQTNPGLLFTTISLPDNYQQKTLRIVTKSPYRYYAGLPAQVFLGPTNGVKRFFLMHSFPQILILILCLGISIAAILTLLVRRKLSKKRILLTGLLSVFSLLVGVQSSVNNLSTGMLLSPDMLSLCYSLTTIVIPIALTSYYWLRTIAYRKWYLPVIVMEYFMLLITIFSLTTQQIPLPVILQIVSGLNVFLTLYTAMISLLEAAPEYQNKVQHPANHCWVFLLLNLY